MLTNRQTDRQTRANAFTAIVGGNKNHSRQRRQISTASIITVLKNLDDGARDVELIGNALPQLDDRQTATTARRRHFVRVILAKLHCNTDAYQYDNTVTFQRLSHVTVACLKHISSTMICALDRLPLREKMYKKNCSLDTS